MKNSSLYLPGFHLSTLRRKPRSLSQKLADGLARIQHHSISSLGECFGQFIPPKLLENGDTGSFSRLPNVFNCNVSRIPPRTELKSHAGESTCYIRCHMGIKIPAEAPVTALHVGGETRSWKEGKVIAFCDGHWHGAKNGADCERLVLIFDVMPERLKWYTRQYCAMMVALNVTFYLLPGRVNLDEPIWRPSILAGYLGLATIGLPLFAAYYLRFKYSDAARPAWSRRLREVGFGFYY